MDCARFREVIHRYIDDELDDARVAELQKHLSFCPACAAELDDLGAVRSALAACGAVTAEVPAGFADRVCAAAEALPQPSFVERTLAAATGGVLPGRIPRRARHYAYGILAIVAAVISVRQYFTRRAREVEPS